VFLVFFLELKPGLKKSSLTVGGASTKTNLSGKNMFRPIPKQIVLIIVVCFCYTPIYEYLEKEKNKTLVFSKFL
jgi:hypothetical protein